MPMLFIAQKSNLFFFILKVKEQTVYEFIVRHFLACCSADAKGMETTITIEVNQEKVFIYFLFIFINI